MSNETIDGRHPATKKPSADRIAVGEMLLIWSAVVGFCWFITWLFEPLPTLISYAQVFFWVGLAVLGILMQMGRTPELKLAIATVLVHERCTFPRVWGPIYFAIPAFDLGFVSIRHYGDSLWGNVGLALVWASPIAVLCGVLNLLDVVRAVKTPLPPPRAKVPDPPANPELPWNEPWRNPTSVRVLEFYKGKLAVIDAAIEDEYEKALKAHDELSDFEKFCWTQKGGDRPELYAQDIRAYHDWLYSCRIRILTKYYPEEIAKYFGLREMLTCRMDALCDGDIPGEIIELQLDVARLRTSSSSGPFQNYELEELKTGINELRQYNFAGLRRAMGFVDPPQPAPSKSPQPNPEKERQRKIRQAQKRLARLEKQMATDLAGLKDKDNDDRMRRENMWVDAIRRTEAELAKYL